MPAPRAPRRWVLLGLVLMLLACRPAAEDADRSVLLTVGERTVSVGEFKEALEMARAAYPPGTAARPEELYFELCRRVLREAVEAVVLEDSAEELGVTVTDAELQAAVSEIRSDYPDGEFERMLLENAVPYALWEKRLRKRILMDKVVDHLFAPPPEVGADEIASLLRSEPHLLDEPPPEGERPGEEEAFLIARVREQKRSLRYRQWLASEIRQRRVEVDPSRWREIAGRPGE